MPGGRPTGSKPAARAPPAGLAFPPPPVKRPAWSADKRSADRGGRDEGDQEDAGVYAYMGAETAALLACVTATLLLLPLLLPPLPPPPLLFLLVPVAVFAVLLLLVFVPSDARDVAAGVISGGGVV